MKGRTPEEGNSTKDQSQLNKDVPHSQSRGDSIKGKGAQRGDRDKQRNKGNKKNNGSNHHNTRKHNQHRNQSNSKATTTTKSPSKIVQVLPTYRPLDRWSFTDSQYDYEHEKKGALDLARQHRFVI